MSIINLQQFQSQVSELLLRHRSLLDVLSKHQQTSASVNRSVIKSITECGCLEVTARKQPYSQDLEQAQQSQNTHMSGQLCDNCMEMVSAELGKNLFYTSALCNLLEIDLQDVLTKESKKCATLGFFNMS